MKAFLTLESGEVTINMFDDTAPKHCAQIKKLANDGFYDGLVFHRVIEGFMAQGGCPDGTGMGGSGSMLNEEFSRLPHERGTCSMARSQNPNSADSQFFICLKESAFLNGNYTVWGQVTEGMDLVDQLKRGEPVNNPDKIISITVIE